MSLRYDPLKKPDANRWLKLDESVRLRMVLTYHRKKKFDLPNENMHAVIHVVVENQVALGDETPVEATLKRMMDEGLDRHDAIHAVGSVLAAQIWDIMQGNVGDDGDPNLAYAEELSQLTAKQWLEDYGE
jgi:hypothetical protein